MVLRPLRGLPESAPGLPGAAEALRVQFFWRVAGLPDAAEDHYLRKQRSELEWIRYALHTWNAFGSEGADAAGTAGAVERIGFVARCWVRGQHQWFRKSARRERGRHLGWHGTSDALFILNLAGAFILFVVLLILLGRLAALPNPGDEHSRQTEWLMAVEHWWVVGLGLTVVVAALCIGYTERLAHAQHGKQYQTMSVLFGRASAALKGALAARPPDLARSALNSERTGQGGAGRERRLAPHAPRTAVGGAAVRAAAYREGGLFASRLS